MMTANVLNIKWLSGAYSPLLTNQKGIGSIFPNPNTDFRSAAARCRGPRGRGLAGGPSADLNAKKIHIYPIVCCQC